MTIPDRVHSRSFPRKEDILDLLAVCQTSRASERTLSMLAKMAGYPPDLRLAINLKTLLGLMIYHEIQNILRDGLTQEERQALAELDRLCLSVKHRETAHGLLNVHERWQALKKLSDTFRRAKAFPDDFADPAESNL